MRRRPFTRRQFRHCAVARVATIAAACALATTPSAPTLAGGSVLGTGGALEITQLLNHVELAKEVAQQAQMISNQIQQYATMIQNLRRLPENWIGEVTMPYREVLAALMQLKASVEAVRQASRGAQEVFGRRVNAMKMLDMTPQEYLRAELQLAEQRGGVYAEAWDADLKAMERAADQAVKLRELTNSIPAISGNIQGLQNLAAHSTMMAGELMELRTSVQRYQALQLKEKESEQQAVQLQTLRNMRALKELEERRKRDAGFTAVPFKYPEWK